LLVIAKFHYTHPTGPARTQRSFAAKKSVRVRAGPVGSVWWNLAFRLVVEGGSSRCRAGPGQGGPGRRAAAAAAESVGEATRRRRGGSDTIQQARRDSDRQTDRAPAASRHAAVLPPAQLDRPS